MSGIVGYGAYVPIYRIKTAEIAKVWGEDAERIAKGLGIKEKAVAGEAGFEFLTDSKTTHPLESLAEKG